MNAEELVSKYLDGSLRESERKILQEMMERSPEFAEEIRGLERLEASLSALRTPLAENDTAFLNNAEDSLLNRMAMTAGAVQTGKGGGGHFWKWTAGAGILLVAGIILWFVLLPGKPGSTEDSVEQKGAVPAVQETTVLAEDSGPQYPDMPGGTDGKPPENLTTDDGTGDEGASRNDAQTSDMKVLQSRPDNDSKTTPLENETVSPENSESATPELDPEGPDNAVKTSPDVSQAGASADDQKKILGQIRTTRRSLRQAESEGNVARQAVLYKQLGLLYGKLEGREQDSRLSLNAARRLAQQEGLTELEAEVNALLRGM